MDVRTVLLKAGRYAIVTPIDSVRAALFFLLTPFLGVLRKHQKASKNIDLSMVVACLAIQTGRRPSDEETSQAAHFLYSLKASSWKWPLLFAALPQQLEYRLFGTSVSLAHHIARLKIIQQELPDAERILDLGGSVGGIPEGGLLHCGYPHPAKEIFVIDLPPELQDSEYRENSLKGELPSDYIFQEQTQVRTVYTSMADLSVFENASVDLAWSGQSIEHVSETDAIQTMREVHRVLKSGGFFCLDTPNWKISSLLTRVGYLHPEHKLEYEPEQLVKMMQAVGFQVECVRAISPLPLSAQLGRFFRAEAYYATDLGDKPDVGFSFFVRARKP
jgi:SAM-dependent methyltransferase